ncbi:alpha-galactosidase [Streptomyces ferrugineus]|uniref:Alpha-galactosidase n=1 Tax=Streptomyces ferrugineus TaxID=1413221 RepID=A0A7M2SD48_9ACTN|nr:glycoside hydrolase family 31 protein [Streptomyces ferrugineus]QOV34244.1 alpha-galactosidase [Streptomyces ferrugineus]
MRIFSRKLGRLLACALTVALLPSTAQGSPESDATTTVSESRGTVTLDTPGYSVSISGRTGGQLALTTRRSGRTVLATGPEALRFRTGDTWQHTTRLTDWSWRGGVLTLTADTTLAGARIEARLTPAPDRYRLDWDVTGAEATELGLTYDLSSAGHWYGHGETATTSDGPYTDQPWPLDAGRVEAEDFSAASYQMVDPFWFTASSAGLYVDTGDTMDVSLNAAGDGLGRFTVESGSTYRATVFVESTPRAVYRDYIGIVGKPRQSDATYEQYAKPLWNSWAQFYTKVDQEKILDYATDLHDNGLEGHTVQLDDKWESNYGNMTFDPKAYPDPRAMSDRIHDLGYDFGLWVTLWINLDSTNYRYAADRDYLLRDAADPTKPCTVTWWNGTAGIVDLANPEARAWYQGNLRKLMDTYRVDGLKFDTRFFDDHCAGRDGHTRTDYQRLGSELADAYDLQGAGIRVHWSRAAHESGFVTRQIDKGTGWNSLKASVTQNLALSTIGYPFVETDMIGGSLSQPAPTKEVLVRWAQSASYMPLMYASISPVDTIDPTTGQKVDYDEETVALYRESIARHERLAPYIWDQVQHTLETGDPIMRPLFFDFPQDEAGYTIDDEWMLGPAVLAAPNLTASASRDIHLPPGTWYDVSRGRTIKGPATLESYPTPLAVTPAFVNLRAKGADRALRALR